MRKIILILPAIIFFVGCASQGKYTYTRTETTVKSGSTTYKTERVKTEVKTPDDPVDSGAFKGNPEGEHEVLTGATQAIDQVMSGITKWTTIVGLLMIIGGLALVAGSGYFPGIAWHKGLWVMAAGAGVIWLPVVMDRYTWVIVIGGVVAALVIFADDIYRSVKWIMNRLRGKEK